MTAALRMSLAEFSAASHSELLGRLSGAAGRAGFTSQYLTQITAWEAELILLRQAADYLLANNQRGQWNILLEYTIPRREKRPDAILLADDVVFVIEFKIGASSFASVDEWQVYSYALDLRDFHAESQGRTIVPMLVVTGEDASHSNQSPELSTQPGSACVTQCLHANDGMLLAQKILALNALLTRAGQASIDPVRWEASAYRPSPTIIEAAETLFAGHSVADISHAFALNLRETSNCLLQAIESSQANQRRTICFVTGIPGAGKTLAGLNTVHDPAMRHDGRPAAVFLSGNGPLVKIMQQALIRNRVLAGDDRRTAGRTVTAFINNVHTFLQTYATQRPHEAPHESAVVFDEAQRAWNAQKMLKKQRTAKSEPELLLEIMQRAANWSVIIALVGGGQEINDGEGGLEEWGHALNGCGQPWHVIASREVLAGGSSVAGHRLFTDPPGLHLRITESPYLHLDVGVRSPRARWLGEWVNNLLGGTPDSNSMPPRGDSCEFPVALTRDLRQAKDWLRSHSDGSQRYGLLASSGALRLRSQGIEVSRGFRAEYKYEDWFLNPPDDYRASNALEVAATEFECQGLELDWTAICWGGDMLRDVHKAAWVPRRIRGTKWLVVRRLSDQRFILNKYRVLLTRARRGMVIWVPRGADGDPTQNSAELDAVADFLQAAGLPMI